MLRCLQQQYPCSETSRWWQGKSCRNLSLLFVLYDAFVLQAIPQLLSGTSTKSKEIGLVPPSYDPRRNERGSAGTTSSDEFNSSDEYTTMGTLVVGTSN